MYITPSKNSILSRLSQLFSFYLLSLWKTHLLSCSLAWCAVYSKWSLLGQCLPFPIDDSAIIPISPRIHCPSCPFFVSYDPFSSTDRWKEWQCDVTACFSKLDPICAPGNLSLEPLSLEPLSNLSRARIRRPTLTPPTLLSQLHHILSYLKTLFINPVTTPSSNLQASQL